MDDNLRNQYVEKIATKISEENIPFDEPTSDVIEYLQKFAITLGVDISKTEELVHESFLYLSMKNAGDIDPLTKGDQFIITAGVSAGVTGSTNMLKIHTT